MMDKKHKITVPEPCHENWDKMTPKGNGKFCLSCTKTVVDFTTMLPDEIQHYFISNPNKSICDRFKNTQLDTISIQIPSRVLYTQTQYHKMFLLALFIAMGTTLFSCADKEGNKKKINKVEVVDKEETPENHVTVGIALPPKDPSEHTLPPPPPPKVDQVKFVKPVTKDCTKPTKNKVKSSNEGQEEESAFVTGAVMQTNAEFPGGIEAFYNFFGKEFKNPENVNATNNKFRISFAVEKDGSLTYLESAPGMDQTIKKEVIRVLKLCPKWQPGESNGKKIKMQYSLPITLE
ncbi:hypothetical protein D0809_02025 [Flavobacterium circumlabens]|uniref:TonB C-terminal domain-containing protein n=1 Tax=Flavobacterium circumlabens TaxID=2133765 RepID=A0A4Y7UHD4_9FLAO|nr:hypothetical protein [Flavobacterium circumlabens]TCN60657.1 hypothetical protein EV142_101229 [Flavobacterium circumlabens]TEB45804.1 hypothetical protein D0809_02025 [Flavobacterium circumlabens]